MLHNLLVLSFFSVAFSHIDHEERKVLPFNSTVINCAQFGRLHLQHKCVLTPEAMEGPYFIYEDLVRSDVTEGKPGVPLTLNIVVTAADTCAPLKGAKVYIWSCDARGYYSGFLKYNPDEPAPPVSKADPSDPSRFLRGVQTTDESGKVTFETIYPGFYYGRMIHIHIEVFKGGNVVYVGLLYFPEDLNKKIEKLETYGNRKIKRSVNNDNIPSLSTLHLKGDFKGFSSSIILGIDPKKSTVANP